MSKQCIRNWVLGFATPPTQYLTPNTCAESALAAQRRDAGRNQRERLVGESLGRLRPSTLTPLQRCAIDRPADDRGNQIHPRATVRLCAVLQQPDAHVVAQLRPDLCLN